jgi:hypothetical protein
MQPLNATAHSARVMATLIFFLMDIAFSVHPCRPDAGCEFHPECHQAQRVPAREHTPQLDVMRTGGCTHHFGM